MKTFSIILTRDTTESTIISVEALTGQEAIDKALSMDHEDQSWDQDYTPNASKDVYCTDCQEDPESDAACEDCGNTLNDGSDVCDQCGGAFK